MASFQDIDGVLEMEVLVAFTDLTQFARYARGRTNREIFETMSHYYELVGDIVSEGGGTVVKFMGDAILLVFPKDGVDAGGRALVRLNEEGDNFLESRGIPCRHVTKAHFGEVACGPMGTRDERRFDLFGNTVNTAALTKSNGMAITPQVFRKLDKETRALLKKHTPAVTYIGVGERHRD